MREVVGSSPAGVNVFFFVLGTFSVHLFSHSTACVFANCTHVIFLIQIHLMCCVSMPEHAA